MIVIATRADLRDRFDMADEAFALSPISARGTLPSESDYEAIREAFMETSRGRWFLGEYAKRNRNADTTMVLDAVARIEETLAAQHQPPEPDDPLPEALAAIRSAVDRAAEAASSAIDGFELEESLAPIRKGARIIKEISWRWREIGADSRICDLIDSQVSAIEGSCGQISEIDPRTSLNSAFDLIRSGIEALAQEHNKDDGGDVDKTVAADEVMVAVPTTTEPVAAVPTEPVAAVPPITMEPVAAIMEREPETPATGSLEIAAAKPDPTPNPPADLRQDLPIVAAVSEVAGEAIVASDADERAVLHEAVLDEAVPDEAALDEAVLEMVALEMAAPDPDGQDPDLGADADDAEVVFESSPTGAKMAVEAPEPVVVPAQSPRPQSSSPPVPRPSFEPSPQPSIGSALLANGFLEQHRAPANDPLGPIRRMSQAEKIAFFS
jgi:hypothetical protein